MSTRKHVPYELLNAREWGLGYDSDEHYETSDDSGVMERDDTWAEAHSGSESRHTNALRPEEPSQKQPLLQEENRDDGDAQGWTVITSRSKVKRPNPSPKIKNVSAPRAQLQKSQKYGARRSSPTQHRHQPDPPILAQTSTSIGALTDQLQQIRTKRERRPRRARIFQFPRDNIAKAAYRRREQPTERFYLHKPIGELEENQPKFYQMLEELGVRTNTFICPPQSRNDQVIPIWGKANDVGRAVANLRKWVTTVDEGKPVRKVSSAKHHFAVERSTASERHRREVMRMKIVFQPTEAERKAFQQDPDPAKYFHYQGWFIWDLQVDPHKVFGFNLEAFDPVRCENACFIVLEERLKTIRILAETKQSVDKTLDRVRVAYLAIKSQNVRNITIHLVDLPRATGLYDTVSLSQSVTKPGEETTLIPRLTGQAVQTEDRSSWLDRAERNEADNEAQFTSKLGKILPSTVFLSGTLQMRIVFGTFGLRELPMLKAGNSLSLDQCIMDMHKPGVRSDLTQDLDLGDDANVIMAQLYRATDLLMPINSASEDLRDVRPNLSARWVFRRFDRPDVQYRIDMKRSMGVEEVYETTRETWTRIDDAHVQKPMEAIVARLDGNLSSKFEIVNEGNLHPSRIDPKMSEFVDLVRLQSADMHNAHLTGRRQFVPKRNMDGVLKPSLFEQQLTFRFRLVPAAQWVLDIARCDRYQDDKNFPCATAWKATLTNSDWEGLMSENQRLNIGERASWDPMIASFFPTDSSITDFFRLIRIVADVLIGLRKSGLPASG